MLTTNAREDCVASWNYDSHTVFNNAQLSTESLWDLVVRGKYYFHTVRNHCGAVNEYLGGEQRTVRLSTKSLKDSVVIGIMI